MNRGDPVLSAASRSSRFFLACHGRTDRIPTFTACRHIACLLGTLLMLSACAAGTIREGRFYDPDARFSVALPPAHWQAAALDSAVLAFRAPALNAGMSLRANCTNPEPGPLSAVARHLFFGLSDKRIDEQEPVTISGVPGIRSRLHARLDDRPVSVEGVTIRRGACLYDFLYVASPERFDEGRPDFERFMNSWSPLGH